MMSSTIADFPARLQQFLERQLGVTVAITNLRHLTGGASRDTWAVDAETTEGPEPGTMRLVIRRDMGGEIDPHALDRGTEFALLQRAHEAGVMVPRPRWLCLETDVLGAAFFIMDRLEGESVGRRVVREPALAAARQLLPRQMGEQLAKIHALSAEELNLPRPAPGQSPGAAMLTSVTDQLHACDEPHPVLELALRWLSSRIPPCPNPVLVHGDFRVGNLMVGPQGLAGIFDWEFAHVGDPAEDIAWPCVRSWRFGQDNLRLGGVGQLDDLLTAYQDAGGARVTPEALAFWEVAGNLRWAIGCITQARRHLTGQAHSVEFASLGRRTCEMELELLNLMEA